MKIGFSLIASFLVLANWGATNQVVAQNSEFTPGDAFFRTLLTRDVIEELNGNNLVLDYGGPAGGNFGGYQGFSKILIRDVPDSVIENLKKIYFELRANQLPRQLQESIEADGSSKLIETNPIYLLVYNKGINFERLRIGLKYNENWRAPNANAFKDPQGKYPNRRGGETTQIYSAFIQKYDAVVHDISFAEWFSPLIVECPEVPWALAGPKIGEPVTGKFADLQFLVLDSDNLVKYFERGEDVAFYCLSNDTMTCKWWVEEQLISKEIESEVGDSIILDSGDRIFLQEMQRE